MTRILGWVGGLVLGVVVGAFVVAGWTGTRFDQWFPDPFAGFTHHQWGALLGGLIGAALSAGIALMVLRRTLSVQTRQFRASQEAAAEAQREQLAAQRRALDEQLAAQAEGIEEQLAHQAQALRTQLEAQSKEASKQRELAARAELIVIVQEMLLTKHGDSDERFALLARISNGIEKFRFELQESEDQILWTELDSWRGVFADILGRMYVFPDPRKHSSADEYLLGGAGSLLINTLVEFRRNFDGKNWTASECARTLRDFREKTLNASRADVAEGPQSS